jgi:CelD/BcsL family acetyltransferase involved in cellulose biosynthesis
MIRMTQATIEAERERSNAPLKAGPHAPTLVTVVNIFSSEPFLNAARDAIYGGSGAVGPVEVEGRTVMTLVTDRGPCLDHPLIDFFEPVAPGPAAHSPHTRAAFAPRVCVDRIDRQTWRDAPPAGATPAPTVDWTRFRTWEDFEAHTRGTMKRLWTNDRRERRRLTEELGPVRLESTTAPGALLDQCLEWKSTQYRRTGAKDLFADRRNTDLVTRVMTAGVGEVHCLYAGDTPIAAQVGMRLDSRAYSWFPAYSSDHHRYSPGRLLLHDILRLSHARGDTEFDFLIGDEDYKWMYATDTRVVVPIGRPGLSHRAHDLRVQLSRRYPKAHHAAKRVLRHSRNLQARLRTERP